MKEILSEEFNLRNENGRLLKWPSIKKLLISQGYIIDERVSNVDSKQTRATVVNYPSSDDSI